MRGTATEYSSHEKAHRLIHCPLSVFMITAPVSFRPLGTLLVLCRQKTKFSTLLKDPFGALLNSICRVLKGGLPSHNLSCPERQIGTVRNVPGTRSEVRRSEYSRNGAAFKGVPGKAPTRPRDAVHMYTHTYIYSFARRERGSPPMRVLVTISLAL